MSEQMNKRSTWKKQGFLAWVLLVALFAFGLSSDAADPKAPKKDTTVPAVSLIHDADTVRLLGEQRYRANCGRCHATPQKFPPRMMATVLRHMRVRATITDDDMRLVLFYMTQ